MRVHRAVFVVAALALGATVTRAQQVADTCSTCHDHEAKLKASAHAAVACAQCHAKRETYPHPEDAPKPTCSTCHAAQAGEHSRSVHGVELKAGNQAAPDCATCHGPAHEMVSAHAPGFRKTVPEVCGLCHGEPAEHYKQSVHGQAVARGVLASAVCTDCHGEHSILRPGERASAVHPSHIRKTCARCHADVRLSRRMGLPSDRLTSFDASFHGLAARAGSQTVANCASCHGFHDILPSSDPKSKIHPDNLGATCGQCHPGAGRRFRLGTIHIGAGGVEPAGVRLARRFYLVVIPLTIGLMLLHHGGDWLRKLYALRLRPVAVVNSPVSEIRMYPWERAQHLALIVSFTVLVWTGFALKYAESWWALPLVRLEGSWPVRGVLHRAAGVALIAVAFVHVALLVFRRDLRAHWLHLIPRRTDVAEAARGFAWNLGLARRRPAVSDHGYIEKTEYWAVVWGTAVMALTGVMLWGNNIMLRLFPKTWLDFATTVHFYEAVLATLAIVVWHFYSVIFDPDVYPMDTAWLNGRTVRRRRVEAVEAAPALEAPAAVPSSDKGADADKTT
jgi:cytochrome b subunit of formate dehydrogenase